jgi:hypothetical protein
VFAATAGAQAPARGGAASIAPDDLREWLGYIASDDLQGRAIHSEGLGLAASYIAEHLKAWGVQPAGEHGGYFQTVRIVDLVVASHASVTVQVNGRSRTFKDGEGIRFPRNMGSRQIVVGDGVEFVGYGLQAPAADINDYAGIDAKGKVVVYLGRGPRGVPIGSAGFLRTRMRTAIEQGAVAVIAGPGASITPDPMDITTVERYDVPIPPVLAAEDEFLDFLFSGGENNYPEFKDRAEAQESLPHFPLKGVRITIDVAADYAVSRTRLTRNVVGIVPGTDAKLKDSFVAFGAHYDHVGYLERPSPDGEPGEAPGGCVGQTRDRPRPGDMISNGADDDGSGTVVLMALARAFAAGPRPKRSLLFVWHSGEEAGLYGSRYNAEHPIVPLETIVANLNIDMVGRNRCDRASEENTVYLVGSDRISTELHNVSEDANARLPRPMRLDYELNDPGDFESLYTRSDHYSYAAKGIPVIFYTTGLHRDYHAVTDEIGKIDFAKMAHVAQLVYATGAALGNLDQPPERDNRGPRMGKGSSGKIGR